MLLILLKSSACLLVLLLFYKIALQPLSIHKLKRIYLLAAILVSAIIPFITFIKYVEPSLSVEFLDTFHSDTLFNPIQEAVIKEEPINYLPTILWSIYGLGVALFLTRFCVNLFGIVSKIRRHTKVKSNRFVNVLMEQLEIPHTFFNFIFLNKNKFENNQIPQEVLLHEQTHAKQKHSLDILLLEGIQIVFWFNPLLFWLKKEVKLNHEFLADQDVINQGIDAKNYQNILLSFSTQQPQYALSNAINYSSIKKRFKLMKTQTPKPTVWLRSLLLLPLLGLLIFSFSSTKEVEKELIPSMPFKDGDTVKEEVKHTARSIDVKVFKNGTYKIDGIEATKNTFVQVINQLHQDITPEVRNNIINIHIDSPKDISDKEVWFVFNAVQDYGFHRIVAYNQEVIRSKGNTPFTIEEDKLKNELKKSVKKVSDKYSLSDQDGATKKQIAEYNTLAKKYNTMPKDRMFIKSKDVERLKYLFNAMSVKQRKKAEPFPNFPEPPKAPKAPKSLKGDKNTKTGFIKINGDQHFYAIVAGKTKYYNRWGVEVDKQGNKLSSTQTDGSKVVPGQNIAKVYNNGKIVSEFKKTWKESGTNIPPPPPPPPVAPIDNASKQTKKLEASRAKMEAKRAEMNSKRNEMEARRAEMEVRREKMLAERQEKMEERKVELKERQEKREETMKARKARLSERIPPPPPPKDPIDHIVEMAKKGASFTYNGTSITSDKAIKIIKKNKKLNISSNTNNGVSTVHISDKGIKTVNGKLVNDN